MTAPSSCLELDDALRPLLVQYPGAAVSALDDVAGLEQHLRAAGAAGVGHPQVTHSGLACSRWRVHFLQIRCEDRSIDRTKLRRVGSTLKRIRTSPHCTLHAARGIEDASIISMATPSQPPLHGTEKAVLDEFSARRTRLNDTYNKITELSAEIAEHELVLKTIAPMDAKRKCFRLVNDVLVERSVGEVMPAVQKNRWVQDRRHGVGYGIRW